jgi:hypothetical protein
VREKTPKQNKFNIDEDDLNEDGENYEERLESFQGDLRRIKFQRAQIETLKSRDESAIFFATEEKA